MLSSNLSEPMERFPSDDPKPGAETLRPMAGVPLAFGFVAAVTSFSSSVRHRAVLRFEFRVASTVVMAKTRPDTTASMQEIAIFRGWTVR
jgi:hypothetical protein